MNPPKVVYVEPDEEITDLVERIRDSGDVEELAFVLPQRARVLQSPLNLRLLQQYSRSYAKKTSIVSGEPRVQLMAREAGFSTYASVTALERGIEVTSPVVDLGASPETFAVADTAAPAETIWTAPVDAAPMRAPRTTGAPLPAAVPRGPRGPHNRRPYYYAAGALFVVGLLLLFLVAPSATVTVTIKAKSISVNKLIQGTTDATAAAGPDHVLTSVIAADENDQFQAKPTGTKAIPATPGTGSVVFETDRILGDCIANIKAGSTFFQTSASPPVVFIAAADAPSSKECAPDKAFFVPAGLGTPGGYGPPSAAIPISAQVAGAAGNVSAGAVNTWPANPDATNTIVTNPAATSGGVDAHNVTVVSDQDKQAMQASLDDTKKRLTDKVKADLQAKASGKTIAQDPSGAGLTVTPDVQPPLPNSGDQYQPTNITVTMHGKAAVYSAADLTKVVNDDLKAQVPNNETLASSPAPNVPPPKITQAADDGTVVFSATGTGFTQPVIDLQKLKDKFTGKSRGTVRTLTDQALGTAVQSVDVSQSIPFFVLPFFSSRIEVKLTVVAGSPTT
ncbi:MAG TPA: hypothetical protein VG266_04845 [Candidatus Dormibacteraeota bacterium]|nr:hypothetical protein [Candidatus Dormibacteraeota bacterium]